MSGFRLTRAFLLRAAAGTWKPGRLAVSQCGLLPLFGV